MSSQQLRYRSEIALEKQHVSMQTLRICPYCDSRSRRSRTTEGMVGGPSKWELIILTDPVYLHKLADISLPNFTHLGVRDIINPAIISIVTEHFLHQPNPNTSSNLSFFCVLGWADAVTPPCPSTCA